MTRDHGREGGLAWKILYNKIFGKEDRILVPGTLGDN